MQRASRRYNVKLRTLAGFLVTAPRPDGRELWFPDTPEFVDCGPETHAAGPAVPECPGPAAVPGVGWPGRGIRSAGRST
jgi:hypothetical protein